MVYYYHQDQVPIYPFEFQTTEEEGFLVWYRTIVVSWKRLMQKYQNYKYNELQIPSPLQDIFKLLQHFNHGQNSQNYYIYTVNPSELKDRSEIFAKWVQRNNIDLHDIEKSQYFGLNSQKIIQETNPNSFYVISFQQLSLEYMVNFQQFQHQQMQNKYMWHEPSPHLMISQRRDNQQGKILSIKLQNPSYELYLIDDATLKDRNMQKAVQMIKPFIGNQNHQTYGSMQETTKNIIIRKLDVWGKKRNMFKGAVIQNQTKIQNSEVSFRFIMNKRGISLTSQEILAASQQQSGQNFGLGCYRFEGQYWIILINKRVQPFEVELVAFNNKETQTMFGS